MFYAKTLANMPIAEAETFEELRQKVLEYQQKNNTLVKVDIEQLVRGHYGLIEPIRRET